MAPGSPYRPRSTIHTAAHQEHWFGLDEGGKRDRFGGDGGVVGDKGGVRGGLALLDGFVWESVCPDWVGSEAG